MWLTVKNKVNDNWTKAHTQTHLQTKHTLCNNKLLN